MSMVLTMSHVTSLQIEAAMHIDKHRQPATPKLHGRLMTGGLP